ncbi:mechanosensitive ion channel family protein [Alteromonas ponticola]|uniref:Small-conductance mechanosensitive channel n=1 Tax=Alteromonas aquimaris TaxID=2998417 RepID=A0ABT3P8Z0_9ALTE|nr:mechanosensitive ion channel family protein [Alteromonas aquimaris]MCW8109214.1 mechanosensitive ion channel family protein [Alteromonas aquimaris]
MIVWVAFCVQLAFGQDVMSALSQQQAANQQEQGNENPPPPNSEEMASEPELSPIAMLKKTLYDIYQDFIERLPYLGAGLIVIILTWIISNLIGRAVFKVAHSRKLRRSLCELFSRLTVIFVWILGLLIAAMIMFPGLTPAKALGGLGLASVAIGFAFKEIFENFFAGILLLWKYPFESGDFIECESILGRVEDISVRMTQIRKTNGELVVMPNSFLFKNPVNVLTDRDVRRITIMTGVAYDEDADKSVEVIEEALKQCETVDHDHPVEIFLNGFGASSIDIEVTWWTSPTPLGHRKSRSEVVSAVKRALDEAGIEIPFPYRTLTFKEPLPLERLSPSTQNE